MPVYQPDTEYLNNKSRWETMRVVLGGQDVIKGLAPPQGWHSTVDPKTYLPGFYPDNTDNQQRYKAYLQRAIFYAITAYTHSGFTGLPLRKRAPEEEIPSQIDYARTNIDGAGTGLQQFTRSALGDVLGYGRWGCLTDQAPRNGITQDKTSTSKTYPAESIIGGKERTISGKVVQTEVRLKESIDIKVDEFTSRSEVFYRVLSLDERGYSQRTFDKAGDPVPLLIGPGGEPTAGPIYPTDAAGNVLREIPFQIIGATNNRFSIDKPPLLDIAFVNIGMYVNSADYEENMHVHGQGTLLLWSDLSAADFVQANPSGINVGARAGHFLGPNGGGQLLQAEPSSALKEAIADKITTMIGMGAQFIQRDRTERTATESLISAAQQGSDLSTVVSNTVEGMRNILRHHTIFMGGDPDTIKFDLNRDFYDRELSAQEASVLIMLRDARLLAYGDILDRLKRAGWVRGDRTAEQILSEVEQDG